MFAIMTIQINSSLIMDITETDFSDIIDIGAPIWDNWATEACYFEPYSETDPEASLTIKSEEGTSIIRKTDIENAIEKILSENSPVRTGIKATVWDAVRQDDWSVIDAIVADAIIQVACFNEIVFG